MAEIGDYVTAGLVDEEATRQGVLTKKHGNNTVTVEGRSSIYHCHADVTVVADEDIWTPGTMEHVQSVRERLDCA